MLTEVEKKEGWGKCEMRLERCTQQTICVLGKRTINGFINLNFYFE